MPCAFCDPLGTLEDQTLGQYSVTAHPLAHVQINALLPPGPHGTQSGTPPCWESLESPNTPWKPLQAQRQFKSLLTILAVWVPLGELSSVSVCPARSVSTIRNQRYHIHANLSCAVLLAQVLLLASFQFSPATVSATLGCCWGLGPRGGRLFHGRFIFNVPWPKSAVLLQGATP